MGKMPIEKLLVKRGACNSLSVARRWIHQEVIREEGRTVQPGEEIEEDARLTICGKHWQTEIEIKGD